MTTFITRGPCEPWVTPADLDNCPGVQEASDEDKVIAARLVSRLMYLWSGKKYPGTCPDEIHVCQGYTCGIGPDGIWSMWWPMARYPSFPVHTSAGWLNLPTDCNNCHVSCITLPAPVTAVTEVWVNGVQLTPVVDYKVSGQRELCRMGGLEWPVSADPTKDKDEAGSFVVVFERGNPIPLDGKDMAKIYARTRMLQLVCTAGCDRVQDGAGIIIADGVTVNYADLMSSDDSKPGRTGIPIVDEWLRAENKSNRRGKMGAHRSDDPRRRSRRWTS